MSGPARLLGSTVALAVAIIMSLPVPGQAQPVRQDASGLVLVQQSTLVNAEGTYTASVVVDGLPDATSLRASVHDRVRSRSELADTRDGSGLRPLLRAVTTPIADLPVEPDGGRRFTVGLSGGADRSVTTPGVYPTEIAALDPTGKVLGRLVTDLIVRPIANDTTPPLNIAVLADMGARSARPPAGSAAQRLVEALAAVPEVPATLALGPSWIETLATSADGDDAALLASLRAIAIERPVLDVPYVDTSPDALADARIAEELPHQLDRGAMVTNSVLGTRPSQSTWLAGPDLGRDGLRLLSALGIDRAIVRPDQVERVVDGVLSPARSFELAPPKEAGRRPVGPDVAVRALLTDVRLTDALGSDEEPALVSAWATAELAMLWFEQPGTPRSVVVPVDTSIDPRAVQELLRTLRPGNLFRPVPLDEAVDAAGRMQDASGDDVRRSLSPADPRAIPDDVADDLRGLRARRVSVATMVGADSPTLAELDRHLLQATGDHLTASGRRRELDASRTVIANLAGAVSAPASVTITLTAREGTVPLTIRNDTGAPVSVRLHFDSSKLDLPEGDDRTISLDGPITRLDVAVRTRTSGAFPFTVDITSPDGAVDLASTTYSVRSTAVSGVGLLLSLGAGLFLVVWWARHWRQSRRSEKLVENPHATTP